MAVLDELILQCLILDGRAPFRRIGEVVGVSEQTVARRVRALHADGLARVVVAPSGFSSARRAWAVRIQCRPDAGAKLADALAERQEVGWIALVSGGSEITCTTTGPAGADAHGVLARLPHSRAVLSFTAQALLRPFAASTGEWTLFDERLSDDQTTHLLSRSSTRPAHSSDAATAATATAATTTAAETALTAADLPLVAALARDGRASAAALARETGWPASRVSARLETLLSGGLLHVGTDFLPEAFGYHATAIMYLTVPPGRIIEVGEALAAHRETGFVAATTGSATLFAVVTCKDSDHLFRYVSERVGALAGVTQMDLTPYLRRVKQWRSRVANGRLVVDA